MKRDSIDFGRTDIPRLFASLFFPTLLSELLIATLNVADGIIVGRGVGSTGLAAVNVASPIFLFSTAFGVMFAAGVSIVAAIHLSKGNNKAADIITTQSLTVPGIVTLIASALLFIFARPLCYLFGGSEKLCPLVVSYIHGISPVPFLTCMLVVGTFIVRLDGTPKLSLVSSALSTVINIALDYIFVFPLGMGVGGAALATSISMSIATVPLAIYLFRYSKTLHLYRPKFSRKAIGLTARNTFYMMKLGFPSFIGELAISFMIISGNFIFMDMLHEDGVAAFGVCCYLFPVVFLFGTAISQSQMPIISFNYGQGNGLRVRKTLKLAMGTAAVLGLLMTVGGFFFSAPMASLFLGNDSPAFAIAERGLPLFSATFLFSTLNVVAIGYYQSIEKTRASILFMVLRGVILVVPLFLTLPRLIGESGLWIAEPMNELLTFVFICVYAAVTASRRKMTSGPGSDF